VALWEDHLLPLLTRKEAARLGCTCEALKEVVREHFKTLGLMKLKKLRAALIAFPRAREISLDGYGEEWADGEKEALVEWLREGGRGSHLAIMRSNEEVANEFIHTAVWEGVLPSLKGVDADLLYKTPRLTLNAGFLRGMHELYLDIAYPNVASADEWKLQLAGLGMVRQLPALAKLELDLWLPEDFNDTVQWPPFIPPSLKALSIRIAEDPDRTSLLRAIPGMIGASGARLDRLKFDIFPVPFLPEGDERLADVAQLLRCCSPTLKMLEFAEDTYIGFAIRTDDKPAEQEQKARLRAQWPDVLAGVSHCRELEVLRLPVTSVEHLFPPGTTFARLTHLEISYCKREHPPGIGVMGLWELMASGGLPALVKLTLTLEGGWSSIDVLRARMAPALEAVAGTLTCLHLESDDTGEGPVDQDVIGYELGMMVGKLRRLKDLTFEFLRDGRAYKAFARGLAASGGEHSLPLLWRVGVSTSVETNADLLASLLLPSVRVFVSEHYSTGQALLLACALRQAGYKHTWAPCLSCPTATLDAIRALVLCRLDEDRIHTYSP
jgi:hypothetical protein